MYLRGDTSILVQAVFSEIVAILTAPAVDRRSIEPEITINYLPKLSDSMARRPQMVIAEEEAELADFL